MAELAVRVQPPELHFTSDSSLLHLELTNAEFTDVTFELSTLTVEPDETPPLAASQTDGLLQANTRMVLDVECKNHHRPFKSYVYITFRDLDTDRSKTIMLPYTFNLPVQEEESENSSLSEQSSGQQEMTATDFPNKVQKGSDDHPSFQTEQEPKLSTKSTKVSISVPQTSSKVAKQPFQAGLPSHKSQTKKLIHFNRSKSSSTIEQQPDSSVTVRKYDSTGFDVGQGQRKPLVSPSIDSSSSSPSKSSKVAASTNQGQPVSEVHSTDANPVSSSSRQDSANSESEVESTEMPPTPPGSPKRQQDAHHSKQLQMQRIKLTQTRSCPQHPPVVCRTSDLTSEASNEETKSSDGSRLYRLLFLKPISILNHHLNFFTRSPSLLKSRHTRAQTHPVFRYAFTMFVLSLANLILVMYIVIFSQVDRQWTELMKHHHLDHLEQSCRQWMDFTGIQSNHTSTCSSSSSPSELN